MRIKLVLLCLIVILFSNSISQAQMAAVPESSGSETVKVDLNGTWKFNPANRQALSAVKTGGSSWKEIKVPGEWTMQGFAVEPGKRGTYYRTFEIPKEWKNSTVYLRCDAVFSEAEIVVNGKDAGSHIGPMVAFEKDVTGLIRYGKSNRIAIGITAETMADTLMSGTYYAAHQLGGILRKIYLYAVPKVHITDLVVQTKLDKQYVNAELKISGLIKNYAHANNAEISVRLFSPEGKKIKLENNIVSINLSGKTTKEIDLSFKIDNPLKWDSEHPNLYRLVINFGYGDEKESIIKKIGFREIEVVGNQVFLNGVPIKLRGVNRHETHPLLGRSLNNKLWEEDAKIFKEGNVNYIRTSHYPPAEEFIEWCDSLGLYVELENPLCWVGHPDANAKWEKSNLYNPELYSYFEQVARENITFYRNHPSIIIWSMANESAWGPNWAKLLSFYNKTDPTRPITFHDQAYGSYNNYGSNAMPIAVYHYPGTRGAEVANDFKRPLLFGEYCHVNCYNRREIATDPGVRDAWGRGFQKMWEGMYKSRGCLGGAIWSGIDDIFYLPNGKAVGYGEWGLIDSWRRKKPEYYHMKKTYSPVKIHNTHIQVPPDMEPLKLQVENRFNFTNLNECKIEWQLGNDSGIANINLAPGKSGILEISSKVPVKEGRVLHVKFFSPLGYLIDESAIEIGNMKRENYPFKHLERGIISLDSTEQYYIIKGNEFSWEIDKKTGKIISGAINNKEVVTGGAELMILPLVTGPCSTDYKLNIPVLNNICINWQMESISAVETNDTISISVTGSYKEASGNIEYLFSPGGELNIAYEFISQTDINPRQYGLVLSVNRNMQNLEWSREGLWTVYPEDHIGRTRGKAIPFQDGKYKEPFFGKKPENKWYHDANELGSNDFRSTKDNIYWASLTDKDNIGVVITGNGKNSFRSFVDDNRISFLVTGYTTGGGDSFIGSHYREERKPLSKGDKFSGKARVLLVAKKEKR